MQQRAGHLAGQAAALCDLVQVDRLAVVCLLGVGEGAEYPRVLVGVVLVAGEPLVLLIVGGLLARPGFGVLLPALLALMDGCRRTPTRPLA